MGIVPINTTVPVLVLCMSQSTDTTSKGNTAKNPYQEDYMAISRGGSSFNKSDPGLASAGEDPGEENR